MNDSRDILFRLMMVAGALALVAIFSILIGTMP